MTSHPELHTSYHDFYQATYGTFITRTASRGPISLLAVSQSAGDFSDEPTDDLSIQRILSRCSAQADFGAGRFNRWGSRGDFALGAPACASEIIVDQPHRIDVVSLPWSLLRARDTEGDLPSDGHFGPAHAGWTRDLDMYALFDRLWTVADSPADSLEIETAIAWIIKRLAHWSRRPLQSQPVERLPPRTLKLVKERLEMPGAPSATLSELAAMCRLSPHHFCRAFKAATGLPPHRYQIVARIERARALLATESLSVAEVALAVGYDDPAYFSRLFSRETGVSPSLWRRERLS